MITARVPLLVVLCTPLVLATPAPWLGVVIAMAAPLLLWSSTCSPRRRCAT